MRKLIFLLLVLFAAVKLKAQQLAQITFTEASQLAYFSFVTDQGVLIRVSPDGKVLEWGTEVMADRGNYFHPQLQPFLARTDYFGADADSALRGKVRSIGTCMLTYYSSFDMDQKAGKLKSVGPVQIDYYSPFENEAYRGRIKFIGPLFIQYHSSFENEMLRGKLKSVGSTAISYYSAFEDKMVRGKIKTIGHVNYSWFSSYERTGWGGVLKSANYRQNIGGVIYVLR